MLQKKSTLSGSQYSKDHRNAPEFCINSRSGLGFSAKFQLALSSTRPDSCTSCQSSPNNTTIFQITLT